MPARPSASARSARWWRSASPTSSTRKSGLPLLSIDNAPQVFAQIMNPDTSMPYIAASIRLVDRQLQAASPASTSRRTPGSSPRSTISAIPVTRATDLKAINDQRAKQGQPPQWPQENFYGWFINEKVGDLQQAGGRHARHRVDALRRAAGRRPSDSTFATFLKGAGSRRSPADGAGPPGDPLLSADSSPYKALHLTRGVRVNRPSLTGERPFRCPHPRTQPPRRQNR